MVEINNKVFGKMTYDFQWEKKECLVVWGDNINLTIAVSAFPGSDICSLQEDSYIKFKSDYTKIFDDLQTLIVNYVNNVYNLQVLNFCEIKDKVRITSILFKRNGQCIILAECSWDTHGLGIEILPKYSISVQDAYL